MDAAGTYGMNRAIEFTILEFLPEIFLYVALAAWAAAFAEFVRNLSRRVGVSRT